MSTDPMIAQGILHLPTLLLSQDEDGGGLLEMLALMSGFNLFDSIMLDGETDPDGDYDPDPDDTDPDPTNTGGGGGGGEMVYTIDRLITLPKFWERSIWPILPGSVWR